MMFFWSRTLFLIFGAGEGSDRVRLCPDRVRPRPDKVRDGFGQAQKGFGQAQIGFGQAQIGVPKLQKNSVFIDENRPRPKKTLFCIEKNGPNPKRNLKPSPDRVRPSPDRVRPGPGRGPEFSNKPKRAARADRLSRPSAGPEGSSFGRRPSRPR